MRARNLILITAGLGLAWWLSRKRAGVTLESLDGSDLYAPEPSVGERVTDAAYAVGDAILSAVGLPQGLRNNNPGNIEWIENPARRWNGMVAKRGRFGVFDTIANGFRALGGELRASIARGQTLYEIIAEWAPASENDTSAYAAHVSQYTGIAPDARPREANIPAIAAAITLHENGQQPFSPADITAWVQA